MSATRPAAILLRIVCCLALAAAPAFHPVWAQSLTSPDQRADVRVLIDVSGSMKQNDPHNLRQPAVELLVKLLPQDSHAGIWLFGDTTEGLVPHNPVTDAWRHWAGDKASSIHSSAMFTDIGSALETAAGAGAIAPGYRGSLILLTDGVVDISKDADANRREWQRITDEVLPRLESAGFVIHTIALSNNADKDLLNKLSLATDGLAATAHSADELMAVFLKIFDAAAPTEQVSLEDNRFTIDASIDEFTALIFRKPGSEPARLRDPDGNTLGFQDRGYRVGWHRAESYDLITVSQPVDGQWEVLADMAPDSRVTVVSNLRLRLRELPTNVYKGQSVPVSFALRENNTVLSRTEFLSLMNFNLELQYLSEGEAPQQVWQETISADPPPASGIFTAQLPKFGTSGDYRLVLKVDGKSFQRETSHSFTAHTPFAAEISAQNASPGGEVVYLLTLRSNNNNIDPGQTQVVATIINPEGRQKVRPLLLSDYDNWQRVLKPQDSGHYRVKVTVKGTDAEGYDFHYQLEEIAFYYSPERGMIRETGGGNLLIEPEPNTAGSDEPESKPGGAAATEPVAAPKERESDAEESPDKPLPVGEQDAHPWALYGSLGIGHILLLGLGFWAYRKVMGNEKDPDAILDKFSDQQIEAPVEAENAVGSTTQAQDSADAAGGQGPDPSEAFASAPEESHPQAADPAQAPEEQGTGAAINSQDIEDLLADATDSTDESDPFDDASLDDALASIMGEFEEDDDDGAVPEAGSDLPEDQFGLREDEEQGGTADSGTRADDTEDDSKPDKA